MSHISGITYIPAPPFHCRPFSFQASPCVSFASLSQAEGTAKCKKPPVLAGSNLKAKERDKCKEKVSCKVAQSGNTSLAPKAPLLPSGTELSYPAQPRAPQPTPWSRLGPIYGWTRVCCCVGLGLTSRPDQLSTYGSSLCIPIQHVSSLLNKERNYAHRQLSDHVPHLLGIKSSLSGAANQIPESRTYASSDWRCVQLRIMIIRLKPLP